MCPSTRLPVLELELELEGRMRDGTVLGDVAELSLA